MPTSCATRSITATPDFMSAVPQPCSTPSTQPRRQVVGDRHGVQVPGQHHPLRPAELGAGQHHVALALHRQAGQGRSAASTASASSASSPDTDSMSTSAGGELGGVRGEVQHDRDATDSPPASRWYDDTEPVRAASGARDYPGRVTERSAWGYGLDHHRRPPGPLPGGCSTPGTPSRPSARCRPRAAAPHELAALTGSQETPPTAASDST